MKAAKRIRWVARTILILWAGFWLYFNVGSYFAELPTWGVGSAVNHLSVALITLLLFIVAWRWDLAGALLLAAAAVSAFFFFQLYEPGRWFVLLALVQPMVIAAILLIACWAMSWRVRKTPQ